MVCSLQTVNHTRKLCKDEHGIYPGSAANVASLSGIYVLLRNLSSCYCANKRMSDVYRAMPQ